MLVCRLYVPCSSFVSPSFAPKSSERAGGGSERGPAPQSNFPPAPARYLPVMEGGAKKPIATIDGEGEGPSSALRSPLDAVSTGPAGSRKRARGGPETPDGPVTSKKKNTAVYVAGLPDDTTVDELVEYFSKYGVIMDDMFTGGPRIKMYEDGEGNFKGEALIVYLREESARLAIDLLDDSYFRLGTKIKVSAAHFGSGGDGEELAQTRAADSNKIDRRVWREHMQAMSRKLEWSTDDSRSPEETAAMLAEQRRQAKYARIVVLRGMFRLQEALDDPAFVLDLKSELLAECERLGEVTAIHVLVGVEDGVCTVKFREREAAAACLRLMQGRYFDGRRIRVSLYDGSFSLKEHKRGGSEDEGQGEGEEERLDKFGAWLEKHGEESEEEDEYEDEYKDKEAS